MAPRRPSRTVSPAALVSAPAEKCGELAGLRPSMVRAILLVAAFCVGLLSLAPASALEAQEFRVTGGHASAPMSEFVGGTGWGFGARYFHWEGLGFGIERDFFVNQSAIVLENCPGGGVPCVVETFDFETETNTTALIVLVALRARPGLYLRFGGGRSASTVVTDGLGRETGFVPDIPPADRGNGPIAWSRGADGNLVIFEAIYQLPLPGPFPLSVYGSFRRHDATMRGCGEGFTPLCGQLNHREFQLGGHLHLFPRREGS